jgi:uncharacterized protein YuzE
LGAAVISVKYDEAANAAKIYLDGPIAPGGVALTYPCDPIAVAGMINLDFDESGHLIGIEVLGARGKLPESVLRDATRY